MKNKKIALENKLGQVVRTFDWHPSQVLLVRRLDTGRIEAYSSKAELDRLELPYEEIVRTTRTRLNSGPVSLGRLGKLRLVSGEIEEVSPSVSLPPENPERKKTVLAWTAVGHFITLGLIILIGVFVKPDKPQEPQVVTIIKQNKKIRPVAKRRTVRASKTKVSRKKAVVRKKVVAKRKTKRKSSRKRSLVKRPNRKKTINKSKSIALNQMGAVGVLGSLKSGKRGGLNLNRINGTAGAGLGGKGGSGGVQTTAYSKGLIAAPLGPGHNIKGRGGYGTKGKGGGNAGYGSISLAGSSSGYFQPLTQEAIVNGGLDRDQVAEVIRKNLGQIIYCYEKGLQVKPTLKGRVAVRFTIGGRGKVNTAGVANSNLGSRNVESCIVKRLKTWKFPKPVGKVNVKVTYPFVLRRVSQG